MGNPQFIDLTKDTWNLVATGVFSGWIHRKSTKPTSYLQVYRITEGAVAPTIEDDGAVLFEQFTSEEIESPEAINVYVWPKGADGRVRVDV